MISDSGAGKSDRRDMPDVFVMKLDRATSEESGTPRLKCYDTMRRDRSSDAEALDELSWVSLLSLLPWSWLLSSICVRCVEKRAGWAYAEGVGIASTSPTRRSTYHR